jgi:hypothetical protein
LIEIVNLTSSTLLLWSCCSHQRLGRSLIFQLDVDQRTTFWTQERQLLNVLLHPVAELFDSATVEN